MHPEEKKKRRVSYPSRAGKLYHAPVPPDQTKTPSKVHPSTKQTRKNEHVLKEGDANLEAVRKQRELVDKLAA